MIGENDFELQTSTTDIRRSRLLAKRWVIIYQRGISYMYNKFRRKVRWKFTENSEEQLCVFTELRIRLKRAAILSLAEMVK